MSMNPRLLRPSASGFTPRSIPGLALWLDASDAATLFQDAAATTPATATSDPVGAWLDKSGNARHATQATAGSRPAISGTTQGGRKALAFASSTTTVVSPATVAQYVADATTSPKMFFAWVARPEGGSTSIVWGSPTHPNSASRVFYASDFGAAGSHIVDFGSVSTARLTGTVGDETNNVGHVYSAFRDGAIMSVRRDGVEIIRKTNASGAYTDTTGTLSINTTSGGSATASWMEFLAYAASMPAANITRIERYLAAKWGITLAPTVSNADAQDWINRVYANGGTVSASTAAAVNTLCDSLDAASLRDRFYRLNLFCGTGLNAALVPLYRGPSLGGTQYGGTTDTNVGGLFVSGDYSESTGLFAAQGTTKYLNTGLAPGNMPQSVYESMHLSVRHGIFPAVVTDPILIGATDSAVTERMWLQMSIRLTPTASDSVRLGRATAATSLTAMSGARSPGFLLGTRSSSTSVKFFRNAVQDGENTTATTGITANPYPFFVFRNNTIGSPTGDWPGGTICSYSIGDDLTNEQVTAFNDAQTAFNAAIGRA